MSRHRDKYFQKNGDCQQGCRRFSFELATPYGSIRRHGQTAIEAVHAADGGFGDLPKLPLAARPRTIPTSRSSLPRQSPVVAGKRPSLPPFTFFGFALQGDLPGWRCQALFFVIRNPESNTLLHVQPQSGCGVQGPCQTQGYILRHRHASMDKSAESSLMQMPVRSAKTARLVFCGSK